MELEEAARGNGRGRGEEGGGDGRGGGAVSTGERRWRRHCPRDGCVWLGGQLQTRLARASFGLFGCWGLAIGDQPYASRLARIESAVVLGPLSWSQARPSSGGMFRHLLPLPR